MQCHRCGSATGPADRFCGACGAPTMSGHTDVPAVAAGPAGAPAESHPAGMTGATPGHWPGTTAPYGAAGPVPSATTPIAYLPPPPVGARPAPYPPPPGYAPVAGHQPEPPQYAHPAMGAQPADATTSPLQPQGPGSSPLRVPPLPSPSRPARPATEPPAWHDHATARPGPSAAVLPAAAPVPWGGVGGAPPILISSVPGFSHPPASPGPATTDVSAPTEHSTTAPMMPTGRIDPAAAGSWRIELDNGDVLPLDSAVVLGRNPSVPAGEHAVVIEDDTRSVSKTHVRLAVSNGEVLVTDLHSTNGVVIVAGGTRATCDPGRPTPVPAGAAVQFGQRTLRIVRPT